MKPLVTFVQKVSLRYFFTSCLYYQAIFHCGVETRVHTPFLWALILTGTFAEAMKACLCYSNMANSWLYFLFPALQNISVVAFLPQAWHITPELSLDINLTSWRYLSLAELFCVKKKKILPQQVIATCW
jgi:hypothetical protein